LELALFFKLFLSGDGLSRFFFFASLPSTLNLGWSFHDDDVGKPDPFSLLVSSLAAQRDFPFLRFLFDDYSEGGMVVVVSKSSSRRFPSLSSVLMHFGLSNL